MPESTLQSSAVLLHDSHESEAKCATNLKRRESNWYLSEIGLLHATLAAIIIIIIIIIIIFLKF